KRGRRRMRVGLSSPSPRGAPSPPSPRSSRGRDERSSLLEGRGEGQSTGGASDASRVHKPHLDEMHGPESLPYPPTGATPPKPTLDEMVPGTESKIYRPTSTREANNLGPSPRSSGGAPGHRG